MDEFDIHDAINLHLDMVDSATITTAEDWYSQMLTFICDVSGTLSEEQFDELNRLVVNAARPLLQREIAEAGKNAATTLATKVTLH